jgi:uncharacterized OB-fold protein
LIALGVCRDCKAVQYPPREVCARCLSDALESRQLEAQGTVLACASIHRSLEPRFAARLPLAIGSVKLDSGPVVIAFLDSETRQAGKRVVLEARQEDGKVVLHAVPLS